MVVDFVALDTGGRPVADLRAAEVSVTIAGRPRAVVGLHCVWRGPGADAAASAAARRTDGGPARAIMRADSARAIVIAVDEGSIPRGSEKPVIGVVSTLLDNLGSADRLAFVRLPDAHARPTFTTDRDPIRQQAAHLAGRAAPPDDLARLREQTPSVLVDDGAPSAQQRLQDAARSGAAALDNAAPPAGASLDTVARLLAALRDDSGPHTVVVVSAGPAPAGTREGATITRCLEAAAASRSTVYVVKLESTGDTRDSGLLAQLAQGTGGALVSLGRNGASDLRRLVLSWSVTYLVEIAPSESDVSGRAVPVSLVVTRSGVRVRAASLWCPRRDPLPATAAAPKPAPTVAAGVPREAGPVPGAAPPPPVPRRRVPITDGELAVVVARATEYVTGYMHDLPNFVAEEEYDQQAEQTLRISRLQNVDMVRRHTRSDFLMVTAPGVSGWMPFRDVFEVDGKKVRDREDRLHKLFLEAPDAASAVRDARRLSDESARFNLGSVDRTINVPTLALLFLTGDRVGGVNFARGPEESVDGIRTWRVPFEEWASPTLVRTTTNADLPATGVFWIDPLTGRLLRTLLRTASTDLRTEISVVYRRNDTIGFWMPAEMQENYENYASGRERVTGHAVYSNFRRFQVTTEEIIKGPTS
jgi:hypothetical protein